MEELLEILNDIQPGVDFEHETHLIDDHLLDSLSIISLVAVAAFGYGVWRQAPISYLSGGLPLVVGFLKYRQIVQFNSLTVKRFQNTYQGQMDVKKYNDYVNKTF